MLDEKIPDQLQYKSVIVLDSSAKSYPGRVAIRSWTSGEAFWRGFKRSAKIVGVLVGIPLPFAFLEPFAFMVWGSVVIASAVLFVGPFLHMTYWEESVSFFFVESECPYCHKYDRMTPYVSTAFKEEFVILCPNCGQTATARS